VLDNLDNIVNLYCYFGNAEATNVSDGDSVFELFDDFDGTSLDTNKWSVYVNYSSYQVNNGTITISGNTSSPNFGRVVIISNDDFTDCEIMSSFKGSISVLHDLFIRLDRTRAWSNVNCYYARASVNTNNRIGILKRLDGVEYPNGIDVSVPDGVWHTLSGTAVGSYLRTRLNRTSSVDRTDSAYTTGAVGFGNHYGSQCEVDFIAVRKAVSMEPTFLSTGNVEIASQ